MDISFRSSSSLNSLSSQVLTEQKESEYVQVEEAIGPDVQHGRGALGQECRDVRRSSLSLREAQQVAPNFQQEAGTEAVKGLIPGSDRMNVKAIDQGELSELNRILYDEICRGDPNGIIAVETSYDSIISDKDRQKVKDFYPHYLRGQVQPHLDRFGLLSLTKFYKREGMFLPRVHFYLSETSNTSFSSVERVKPIDGLPGSLKCEAQNNIKDFIDLSKYSLAELTEAGYPFHPMGMEDLRALTQPSEAKTGYSRLLCQLNTVDHKCSTLMHVLEAALNTESDLAAMHVLYKLNLGNEGKPYSLSSKKKSLLNKQFQTLLDRRSPHPDLIEKFVQAGADVNLGGTNSEKTALHHADVLNHPALVSYLLMKGASPDRCDAKYVTPRILAKHCKDSAIGLLIDGVPIKKPTWMARIKTAFS